jgi:hypothetical protein
VIRWRTLCIELLHELRCPKNWIWVSIKIFSRELVVDIPQTSWYEWKRQCYRKTIHLEYLTKEHTLELHYYIAVSLGLPSETIIVNSTRIRCRWNEIIHSLQFGDFEYNYSTLFHPSYSISSAVANISRSLLVPSRTSNPFLSYIQTPMVANTILLDLNFERQVLDDDTVTKTKMVTNKISAAKVTFPFSSPKVSPRPSSLIQLPPSSEREFFPSHTYECGKLKIGASIRGQTCLGRLISFSIWNL